MVENRMLVMRTSYGVNYYLLFPLIRSLGHPELSDEIGIPIDYKIIGNNKDLGHHTLLLSAHHHH